MVKSSSPKTNRPQLPSLSDRIPPVVEQLNLASQKLEHLSSKQAYMPIWEPLYKAVHSLKGLCSVIDCSVEQKEEITELSRVISLACYGDAWISNPQQTAVILSELALLVEQQNSLSSALENLANSYGQSIDHQQRLQKIFTPVPQLDGIASKKAYEAKLLELDSLLLTEDIVLDHFISWLEHLERYFKSKEVELAPYFIHTGSYYQSGKLNTLQALAWICCGTTKADIVCKELKLQFPKAQIQIPG